MRTGHWCLAYFVMLRLWHFSLNWWFSAKIMQLLGFSVWKLRLDNEKIFGYWHYSRSVWSRVYETVWRPSVFALSVCAISRAAAAAGHTDKPNSCMIFVRSTALSSKCEQCHVDSRRRKLNTDLLCLSYARVHTRVRLNPARCQVCGRTAVGKRTGGAEKCGSYILYINTWSVCSSLCRY